MPRSRLRIPAALLLCAAPAAWLLTARVPAGSFGVSGGAALAPGWHLAPGWVGPALYPAAAVEVSGSAPAVTREGARVQASYRLSAQADPSRAGLLPPRVSRRSDPSRFPGELTGLVESILGEARRGGETLEERVQAGLEAAGLSVREIHIAGALAAEPAGSGPETAEPAPTLRNPIVLIGLDGADWQVIDPLIEAGKLPHLAALKRRSRWGHLRSYEPILSPLLWTTAATGKPPDEHGIIDFLVADPSTGRKAPITSRSRKVKALWNIFSDSGLGSAFVAWWASWPAEPVRGRIVSDRVAYSLFQVKGETEGLTWPPSLMDSIRPEMVAESAIGYETLARFVDVSRAEHDAARARAEADPEQGYKEPINHLARILASTGTYHAAALALIRQGQPDLTAVYYQGIDEVSHRFAHFMPPRMAMVREADFRRYRRAVEAFYGHQDALLGELLGAVHGESIVLVMSDHGFHNGPSRPTDGPADIEGKPGKWHRLYGIVMAAGPGIEPGRFDTATLYDIAPTILALAGLPSAGDMPGTPLLPPRSSRRVATYEGAGPPGGPGPSGAAEAGAGAADEELLRNLASLGYIGGAPDPGPSRAAAAAPRPGTITSHMNLAGVLLQKGDAPGAESEARKALAISPGYFPALATLAQTLVRQGRTAEALDATRRAVASSGDAEPGLYAQLALLASRQGESRQAANFLSALRRERPRSAGIDTALGLLAEQAGDREAARGLYAAALRLDPAAAEPMGRLFTMARAEGSEAALEDALRRALAINDRSVMHLNWLGLILASTGRAAEAERLLQRALDLAPDFGGTMANLGSLYGRAGRLEEAASILSRALRIEPRNLEARVSLGAALAKLGRLDEAIARLEEARRLGLRSPELLNAMGLAYAESGRKSEAIDSLRESLTLSPGQPQVEALLSELTRPS
ncbi:MAG TPA: alkaline phosphatase family protein [Candidatus Polarisedimenticolia bacterium]|nr:alkaline phosphatase family protein [Candidatus Polarisedimenticolia bacterium]